MPAVFTSDVILAHLAALSGILKKLSDPVIVDSDAYSLDHLDAMAALLACAAISNRITDMEDFTTITQFMRFCDMCEHIASSIRLDIPEDKCIHQITAFLVVEISKDTGEDFGAPLNAEGQTIN